MHRAPSAHLSFFYILPVHSKLTHLIKFDQSLIEGEVVVAQGDPLRIEFDDIVGRHGIARRDISFGEIILVDNPIGCVPVTLRSGIIGKT